MTTFRIFKCKCGQNVLCESAHTIKVMDESKVKDYIIIYHGVCGNCATYLRREVNRYESD